MDQVERYLRRGERICWQGETGRFRLLEPDVRGLVLGKWVGTGAAGAALLALYLGEQAWNPWAAGAILLGTCLLLLSPVLEWDELRGQRYWMTDQRVLVMTKDRRLYAMERREVRYIRVVRRRDGQDCLVLSRDGFPEAEGQLRWCACHPKSRQHRGEAEARPVGRVLYGVQNADEALDCLEGWDGPTAA